MSKNDKAEEIKTAEATEVPEAPEVAEAPKTKQVYVPKAGVTDTGRQFVSVNGRSFLVPKGGTHELPAEIADEIIRGQEAEKKRDAEAAKRAQIGV